MVSPVRRSSGEVRHPSPPSLGPGDRVVLLRVARVAVAVAAHVGQARELGDLLEGVRGQPVGSVRGAAFVTLYSRGELRACMGTRDESRPLPDSVADAALSSALDDPRFPPLAAGELPRLRIEISVLGRLLEVADPESLRPGVDGVVVERDGRRGLLLPEVASEQGWDVQQLLAGVCQKAWLPPDAWQEPGTRLHAFRTLRFGGPATRR